MNGTWEDMLISSLPERPPEHVETFRDVEEELGPPLIIYRRESRTPADWEYEEFFGNTRDVKYHWTATCRCTQCGEEFFAPWGKESFYVVIGEDNETYANFFSSEEEMVSEIRENDWLFCPNCGEQCLAVPARSLGSGRTFRTQAASLENVNGTAAIVYWLYSRRLTKNGYGPTEIEPREAIAISPEGKLVRFSHADRFMGTEYASKGWEKRKSFAEPELLQFKSEGCRKIGSFYIGFDGDLSGTTGEKTGLDAYWPGDYPSAYLKLWRKHPNIENLARSGAAGLLPNCIHRMTSTYYNGCGVNYSGLDGLIDWSEKKPHRMLSVRKEDYRRLCAAGWTMEILEMFQDYAKFFPATTAERFEEFTDTLNAGGVKSIKGIWDEGLDRIIRYLEKQAAKEGSEELPLQMFKDYRDMMLERNMLADLGELTAAEKYPVSLRRAHDRIAREHNARLRAAAADRHSKDVLVYAEKFLKLYEEYSALEYSDGEICIVVPQSPLDLIKEGHILNHCVGGYSDRHCAGRPIFFVRHARRPERSWYTLNENLTGDVPSRVQLHGYGNEFANGKRLTIPKKVLDFVESWERDVLAPWYQNNRRGKTA